MAHITVCYQLQWTLLRFYICFFLTKRFVSDDKARAMSHCESLQNSQSGQAEACPSHCL